MKTGQPFSEVWPVPFGLRPVVYFEAVRTGLEMKPDTGYTRPS